MTKRFLLDPVSKEAYYGAIVSVVEFPISLAGLESREEEVEVSSSGLLAAFSVKNLKAAKIEVYEKEADIADERYISSVDLNESNGYESRDLKLYKAADGVLYLKIYNLSESSETLEIIMEFIRFFEVETTRNIIEAGTIEEVENKIYNIFVTDTACRLESLHLKTKIGACTVGIYSGDFLKYQSVANNMLVKKEPITDIIFSKDSLISLRIEGAVIVEDLFFNMVFTKLN